MLCGMEKSKRTQKKDKSYLCASCYFTLRRNRGRIIQNMSTVSTAVISLYTQVSLFRIVTPEIKFSLPCTYTTDSTKLHFTPWNCYNINLLPVQLFQCQSVLKNRLKKSMSFGSSGSLAMSVRPGVAVNCKSGRSPSPSLQSTIKKVLLACQILLGLRSPNNQSESLTLTELPTLH